jgi:tetratricopeptide (TPR) repeat protein
MRAVFDHSWRLLSEPERRMFSRLAVFRDGWSPAAAKQVAGATLADLALLAGKSLARPYGAEPQAPASDVQPGGAPEPRFGMLEPLQRAHASHYLALAETAAAQWGSPTDDAVTKQLDREHDNLRAALQWARDGGDLALGLRLAGALRKFWQRRGWMREGQLWLAELLARAEARPGAIDLATELSAIHAAAWLASYQHDFAQAAALFERSIALQHTLGEAGGEPQLLCDAAFQARAAGQSRRAAALLEEAEALYRARDDRGSLSACGLGLALYGLGLLSREQGDFERANRLFEACAELHRDIGDPEGVAQTMLAQSDSARDRGDLAQMRAYLEPSLAVFRELGAHWAIGFAVHNLALGAYLEGDLEQAHAHAQESTALFRRLRADASLAEVLVTLGGVLRARGDRSGAHAALAEALQLAWAVGPRVLVALSLEGLAAGLAVHPGQAGLATRLLAGTAALRAQMGTPLRPIDRAGVEQTLAKAQAAVGVRAFAAAWKEGQAQPLGRLLGAIPDAAALAPARERSIG